MGCRLCVSAKLRKIVFGSRILRGDLKHIRALERHGLSAVGMRTSGKGSGPAVNFVRVTGDSIYLGSWRVARCQ